MVEARWITSCAEFDAVRHDSILVPNWGTEGGSYCRRVWEKHVGLKSFYYGLVESVIACE